LRRRDARQIASAALEQNICSATDGYSESRAARQDRGQRRPRWTGLARSRS